MKHKVHVTLQGKGGVGKSLVASFIAQYYQQKGEAVICLDADPVNQTFLAYKAFDAKPVSLMEESRINERGFDAMMETILNSPCSLVVDNGASSFIPMAHYLIENEAINMIRDSDKEVVIHTVIAGGQALLDTLQGFAELVTKMPETVSTVLWLNQYFGPIESDGITFENMKVFQENKYRIYAMIHLVKQSADTFGKDIAMMLDKRLTFQEAINSPIFTLMAKQRLAKVKRTIFKQLDMINL